MCHAKETENKFNSDAYSNPSKVEKNSAKIF